MPHYPEGTDMAWDIEDFHPNCPAPQLLLTPAYMVLYCPSCRCVCHFDVVATRTSLKYAISARPTKEKA
jgi:hypothetical protein